MSADGDGAGQSRPDPARDLLARARRTAGVRRKPRRPPPQEQRWSGPGPDERDPAPVGRAVDELVTERAWASTLRAAGIEARWAQIVGAEVAAHCRPERLERGVLHCVAESTAWATQMRWLSTQLLDRITAEVGPGVVARLQVRGPTAPDWRHGPLRVSGRGPRDTYG